MALNSSGYQVSVLPTYQPVTQGLNLSNIVPGIQQGLGLVGDIQQQRRLRNIISDEEAARQELALARPLRELQRARDEIRLSEPIVRPQYDFLGAPPGEESGLGLYQVQTQIDPRTRAETEVNQFIKQLKTPEQMAIEAEDRQLKQLFTESQIKENNAQAEARLRPPAAVDQFSKLPRVRILQVPKGGKLYHQEFILNDDATGYTPGRFLGEAPPRAAAGGDEFDAMLSGKPAQGEVVTQEDVLTPDEAVQLTTVAPARANQAPAVSFPAAVARGAKVPVVNGMPSFDSDAAVNAAIADGTLRVGDVIVFKGKPVRVDPD